MTDSIINEDGSANEENLKKLRKKADQVDGLTVEVQRLTRELALRDSKVNREHPTFELFQAAYKGDWTSDALNEAAGKYGLLVEEKKQEVQGQQQQVQQQQPEIPQFTPMQLQYLQQLGINPQGQQQQAQQAGFASQAYNQAYQQAAQAQQAMDAAQQGGQLQQPGQLSNDNWMRAKSPEEFLAQYQAAGGQVLSNDQ